MFLSACFPNRSRAETLSGVLGDPEEGGVANVVVRGSWVIALVGSVCGASQHYLGIRGCVKRARSQLGLVISLETFHCW